MQIPSKTLDVAFNIE